MNQFSRTELVMGDDSLEILKNSRVAIFGVGGVGGYTVEALTRSGIGALDLIDDDKVCLTNINRQIIATRDTVGHQKVEVCEERIHSINPDCVVTKHETFYLPEKAEEFQFDQYDYIVDAIDTVSAKLDLVMQAQKHHVPIIAAMGCGNRVDPGKLVCTDIYQTSMDPLSKVMRRELKKRGVPGLKVVYSTEPPIKPYISEANSCQHHCICPPGVQRTCLQRRSIPGSTAFVPAAAGLMIAAEVVRDLTHFDPKGRVKGGRQE